MVLGAAGAFQKHLIGARDRNRTCDLRVTSALLYRLSYTGGGLNLALTIESGNFARCKNKKIAAFGSSCMRPRVGAAEGCDLLIFPHT